MKVKRELDSSILAGQQSRLMKFEKVLFFKSIRLFEGTPGCRVVEPGGLCGGRTCQGQRFVVARREDEQPFLCRLFGFPGVLLQGTDAGRIPERAVRWRDARAIWICQRKCARG